MPLIGPLFAALLAIATIAGMAITTQNWSQQRNAALYADIEADIEKTLRQHNAWKAALAKSELQAPPNTDGSAAATDNSVKPRKAQTTSLRKRVSGPRRERLVPPDFARLPAAIVRGAFGFAH